MSIRWLDRCIGFLSTLILARLLAPDDFGVIAAASLAIGLADALFDANVQVALIKNKGVRDEHYHTAWTVRMMQCSLSTLLLMLAAPYVADYFNDPRVTRVVQALSLLILMNGLGNIWIIEFQKNMQFDKDFRFLFSRRVVGFLATVISAYLLQSYWAMVIGSLSGRAFGVAASYLMHAKRPRWCLEEFREIFVTSQWMLINSVIGYLTNNLHRILTGRHFSSPVLGAYTLANEISGLTSAELLGPLNRVLFPALARLKDNVAELKRTFLLAQNVQMLVVIPASVGMILVSRDLVLVLLGAKWEMAVPFIELTAWMGIFRSLISTSAVLNNVFGKLRQNVQASLLQLVLFVAMFYTFARFQDASEVILFRIAALALASGFVLLQVTMNFHFLRMREFFSGCVRPLLAAALMAAVIMVMNQYLVSGSLVALLAKVAAGALAYSAAIYLLWLAAGAPAGAEAFFHKKISGLLKRR